MTGAGDRAFAAGADVARARRPPAVRRARRPRARHPAELEATCRSRRSPRSTATRWGADGSSRSRVTCVSLVSVGEGRVPRGRARHHAGCRRHAAAAPTRRCRAGEGVDPHGSTCSTRTRPTPWPREPRRRTRVTRSSEARDADGTIAGQPRTAGSSREAADRRGGAWRGRARHGATRVHPDVPRVPTGPSACVRSWNGARAGPRRTKVEETDGVSRCSGAQGSA